ncbi:MAG: gamma-glutamylcyclotransferase family protein [Bacillota bacterium]
MGHDRNRGRDYVFVYGTLMSGHGNHFYLHNSRFLGNGEVHGLALYDVTSCFPGAVREKRCTLLGEVYEVNFKTMTALDRLESNGFLYKREKFPVILEGKQCVTAWVYIWMRRVKGCKVPKELQPWGKGKLVCNLN